MNRNAAFCLGVSLNTSILALGNTINIFLRKSLLSLLKSLRCQQKIGKLSRDF